jgi:hypothetical protein
MVRKALAPPPAADVPQAANGLAKHLASASRHDIVNTLLSMVLAELPPDVQVSPSAIAAINKNIRLQYGGTRITIHQRNPIDIDHRRDTICALYAKGEQLKYLATKFDLSQDRILQIIKDRR